METKELRECIFSLVVGNIATLFAYVIFRGGMSGAAEIIAFWLGGWYFATYVTWSVIDWWKEKRRDAGQSNHGSGKARKRMGPQVHYSRKETK